MADVCLHPLIISRSEQQPKAYYFYTNICVISCDSPLQAQAPFLFFLKISLAERAEPWRAAAVRAPSVPPRGGPGPGASQAAAGPPASPLLRLAMLCRGKACLWKG